MEGTECGSEKHCQGGECVKKSFKNPDQELQPVPGGWSEWETEECQSGCMYRSKGYKKHHRTCNSPAAQNTEDGCEGMSFDVTLCNDFDICPKSRKLTPTNYATVKCKEFSKLLPDLNGSSPGIQAPHEQQRMWMACTIFCRRKDNGAYYTPRLELNDLGVDAYFPDGTLCHHDSLQNFYCLRHHCLPESFRFTKTDSDWLDLGEDVPWIGNASPREEPRNEELMKYLSLDPLGEKPLSNRLRPGDVSWKDGDWTNKDFLPLPENQKRWENFRMK